MKKSELLDWLQEEYQQWEAFLEQVGRTRMDLPEAVGPWSIKDLVAHLTVWNRRLVARLQAAGRGQPEPPPPWPTPLQTEDEINAWIYESNHGRPLGEVLDESRGVFQQLLAVIEGLPDEVRIDQKWHLVWLDGQYFPAGEFFDHFHDDHEPDIRLWLARMENNGCSIPISVWRTVLWKQFGAAIDMLANAIRLCPDELWLDRLWEKPSEQAEFSQFWYLAYHTLFWLDLYLSGAVEGFAPPAPFTLGELEAGLVPDRTYTKEEIQAYLDHGRKKCQATIEAMTDAAALRRCRFPWGELSFAELLLYNMRHVQEHAAQLSLRLGQRAGSDSGWVTRAKRSV